MSLQDGTSKMSKSAENDMSRINLLDTPDEIRRKVRLGQIRVLMLGHCTCACRSPCTFPSPFSQVKRCKTDSIKGIGYSPDRPEANNLLGIYEAMTGRTKDEVAAEAASWAGWGEFKPLLADALVAHLEPLQSRYREIVADPAYLDSVLAAGAEEANEVATRTLVNAKRAMGFTMPGQALPKKL